jgi:hypothetical protein
MCPCSKILVIKRLFTWQFSTLYRTFFYHRIYELSIAISVAIHALYTSNSFATQILTSHVICTLIEAFMIGLFAPIYEEMTMIRTHVK